MIDTKILFFILIKLLIIQLTYQITYECDKTAACGCSSNPATLSRIVGGEESGINTWSWTVSININNVYQCGGSILSSSWIITAAHCVKDYLHLPMIIYAGSNIKWFGTQNFSVVQIIIHPGFNSATYENDIAILRLDTPLNMLDPNIRPICMPNVNETILQREEWPKANTSVVAVGWGSLTETINLPNKLQQVTLQTIEYQELSCKSVISNHDVQLCASVPNGEKDTCFGDSGGPLMMYFKSKKQWILVGLTSYGIGCARPNYAGIYTRVAVYKDWIRSFVNDSYWINMNSDANTITTPMFASFYYIIFILYNLFKI